MTSVGRTRRLFCVEAPDLRDVVFGIPDGGRKLQGGLAVAVGASTPLEIIEIGGGGWLSTLELLRADRGVASETIDLLLTSVSSELADPSPEPRECLIELVRFVREHHNGRVAVLNASSLVPVSGSHGDPLDLRIRRLDLAVMEASHATGLSVVDADQVVAEMGVPGKVMGPFDYSPVVCEALRSRLVSILDEIGFAERSIMEARVPFVSGATGLTVENWFKSEGHPVAADDVICELRLGRIKQMGCPRSAIDLASIDGRRPLLRALFSREQERMLARNAVLPLVARESAILRRILRPAGAVVQFGDSLALLTRDLETPINASGAAAGVFPAVLRTDNVVAEMLL